jgi:hypothetical protein
LIIVEAGFKKVKIASSTQVLGEAYVDNIQKYLELFPKGRLPSGKAARSDKKNIESNFKWFFQNYEYDWNTVLQATARYVDEFEKKNFLYMRNSQYFISKMSPDRTRESELANYCSAIKSGDTDDTPSDHFKDHVV